MKMSTPHEIAQCVSWFIETMSDIVAQRNFRRKYGRKPPARLIIRAWHKKFMETGSVLLKKGAGRPQISEEEIESVRVHIPEALESPFAGLLRSYRFHAALFTKFCIESCDFMHIQCSYCKPLSQKISRDEMNLQ